MSKQGELFAPIAGTRPDTTQTYFTHTKQVRTRQQSAPNLFRQLFESNYGHEERDYERLRAGGEEVV